MPESTDVFVIVRNGDQALLNLGYFVDEDVAGGVCFGLSVDMPDDVFDTLRIPFGGDGECCGECECCSGETEPSEPECIGADDPTCTCNTCLEGRVEQF